MIWGLSSPHFQRYLVLSSHGVLSILWAQMRLILGFCYHQFNFLRPPSLLQVFLASKCLSLLYPFLFSHIVVCLLIKKNSFWWGFVRKEKYMSSLYQLYLELPIHLLTYCCWEEHPILVLWVQYLIM